MPNDKRRYTVHLPNGDLIPDEAVEFIVQTTEFVVEPPTPTELMKRMTFLHVMWPELFHMLSAMMEITKTVFLAEMEMDKIHEESEKIWTEFYGHIGG